MRYRRAFAPGGCYFFTLALQDRKQDWLVRHIDDLRRAFAEVKQRLRLKSLPFAYCPNICIY